MDGKAGKSNRVVSNSSAADAGDTSTAREYDDTKFDALPAHSIVGAGV